jgi:hypothetical protein
LSRRCCSAELLEALTSFRRLALGAKHRQLFDHEVSTARHQNKIPPSAPLNCALPPSTGSQFLPHITNTTTLTQRNGLLRYLVRRKLEQGELKGPRASWKKDKASALTLQNAT